MKSANKWDYTLPSSKTNTHQKRALIQMSYLWVYAMTSTIDLGLKTQVVRSFKTMYLMMDYYTNKADTVLFIWQVSHMV